MGGVAAANAGPAPRRDARSAPFGKRSDCGTERARERAPRAPDSDSGRGSGSFGVNEPRPFAAGGRRAGTPPAAPSSRSGPRGRGGANSTGSTTAPCASVTSPGPSPRGASSALPGPGSSHPRRGLLVLQQLRQPLPQICLLRRVIGRVLLVELLLQIVQGAGPLLGFGV